MADRIDLASAMRSVTMLRNRGAHRNTVAAAERRLRTIALDCDTRYGAADPHEWAADWLTAVSSGHPCFQEIAQIAEAFRALSAPPADPEHFTGHRRAFAQEAA